MRDPHPLTAPPLAMMPADEAVDATAWALVAPAIVVTSEGPEPAIAEVWAFWMSEN